MELEKIVVLGEIENNARLSTSQLEETSGLAKITVRRILKAHKFHSYRARKIHHLHLEDFSHRVEFCQWFLGKCEEDRNFP